MPDPQEKYQGDFLAERAAGAPSTLRQILFHVRVLRAGWGVVLFLVVLVGSVLAETVFVEHYRTRHTMQSWFMTPHDILDPLLLICAAVLATVVPSLLEQRHLNDYGFKGSPWKPAAAGFVTSLGLVTIAELGLRMARAVQPTWPVARAGYAVKYGVIWLAIFVMLAMLEELLTRGYLQYTLTRGLAFLYRRFLGLESGVGAGFWTAAVVLSGAFAWLYRTNPGQTQMGLFCIFVMGLLYNFSLWRTGSLWWAVGFHAAWDFTQAFVFGQWSGGLPIRDHLLSWAAQPPALLNGGAAGLNGSATVYLVLAAAVAAIVMRKKVTVYPELWAIAEYETRDLRHADTLPDPDRA